MKIYIFRHAQKAMDFSGDPDLTAGGHDQASKLLDRVLKHDLVQPTELWVSPKRRTHSTFRPLSEHFKLPLQTQEALLEQEGGETISDFRRRIEHLIALASNSDSDSKADSVIFMCSHYDWVIEAMSLIPCDTDLTEGPFAHWNPCQYAGFETGTEGVFTFLELKGVPL